MSKMLKQRSTFLARLDARITAVETRLRAAERMRSAYTQSDAAADPAAGEEQQQVLPRVRAAPVNLSWVEVRKVVIPRRVDGRPLRPKSKRALIIQATKAFLQANGRARRPDIVEFLTSLGIIGKEKNPASYLSVTLSSSKEIFASAGGLWRLRDAADGQPPSGRDIRRTGNEA